MSDSINNPNGSRFRIPAIKWRTALLLVLTGSLAFQFWLTYRNVTEWELSRQALASISTRVAEDRRARELNNSRMLNELKLQTFNNALPSEEQRKTLTMLFNRLDDETQRDVRKLNLRTLMGAGPQESEKLQPQGQRRHEAP